MKPEAHTYITLSVLKEFEWQEKFQEYQMKYILKGVEIEDYSPILPRIVHWHFYRQVGSQMKQKVWWFFNPTSELRLANLIEALEKSSQDDHQCYITLGRILHHIQDMSTPSHVRPIYHGIITKDDYEEAMMHYVKDEVVDPNYSDTVTADNFYQLYEKYAHQTLDFISDPTSSVFYDGRQIPFTELWIKDEYGNFGRFGKYYCDVFKIPNISQDQNSDVKSIYLNLAMQAMQSTHEALLYFQNIRHKI